jgi:hypothetical protein
MKRRRQKDEPGLTAGLFFAALRSQRGGNRGCSSR